MPGELIGWESLALTASFIGVLGALLLYMISRMFNLPALEQTAKSELIFAASTIFIVASAIILVQLAERILPEVALEMYAATFGINDPNMHLIIPPPNNTVIDIVKLYLKSVVNCAKIMLKTLYVISIPVEAIASVFMEIFMSEHASGFAARIISERIKNLTEILTFYVFMYYFIVHILNFIKYYWSFFFTVGVVCRAFPLTRGAGAYLMAISLGLYIVFPFSYVLVGSTISMFTKSDFYSTDERGNTVCLTPAIPQDIKVCTIKGDYAEIADAKMQLDEYAAEINSFFEVFTPSVLRHMTAVICFIPFITLIITVSFVLSSTSLFGGTIPEVGRGLIKLI